MSDIEDEMGDVLFSMVNYARFLNVDAENALERTNKKFMHNTFFTFLFSLFFFAHNNIRVKFIICWKQFLSLNIILKIIKKAILNVFFF